MQLTRLRVDETCHRLLDWTHGQAPSERLAAVVLSEEGYQRLDPSHPNGGKDGGRDALCERDGLKWVMAVYFPRGQQGFGAIRSKFNADLAAAKQHQPGGFVFVTNQELRLSERDALLALAAGSLEVEIYHQGRLATILDTPRMASVRKQFLFIDFAELPAIELGGKGGQAPGAGGGGGGAMGDHAQGGPGGRGGAVILQGEPGLAPGAGGGGAGAIGDKAAGGGGGEGGERIVRYIAVKDLPDVVKITIGEGGKGGLPGQPGGDGGDSSFGDIVAKGGKGGPAGLHHRESRAATDADRNAGFHVSSLMLAREITIEDGNISLAHGGWARCNVATLPMTITWPWSCTASFGTVPAGTAIDLDFVLAGPEGTELARKRFTVTSPAESRHVHFVCSVTFEASVAGYHMVSIWSGDSALNFIEIQVLTTSPARS